MMETRAVTATCRCGALAARLLVFWAGPLSGRPQPKNGKKNTSQKGAGQNSQANSEGSPPDSFKRKHEAKKQTAQNRQIRRAHRRIRLFKKKKECKKTTQKEKYESEKRRLNLKRSLQQGSSNSLQYPVWF